MGKHRGSWVLPAAATLGIAIIAAACSSSGSSTTTTAGSSSTTSSANPKPTANENGVTATAINVGAISTLTGSIASDFNGLSPGIKAYFDMVNAQGGINGRKLVLAYNLDDGGQPSQFTQLTHTLIDQDHAFAVMVASYWFTPNYFVETHTPTYGYNVSGNWQGPDNLFAAGGSVQNYHAGVPVYAYLAKKTDSKKIAIISYGPVDHLLVRRLQHHGDRPGQGRVRHLLRGPRRPAGRELFLCRPEDAADRDRHGDQLHAGAPTTSPWPGPSSSTG